MIGRSTRRRLAAIDPGGRRRRTVATPPAARYGQYAIALLVRRGPRTGRAVACCAAAIAGGAAGGPVAGVICGVYGGIAASAWYAALARRLDDEIRRESIDAICEISAGLRAGVPPAGFDRIRDVEAARCVGAARGISERLGAPLADLLDRVDADLRSRQRVRAELNAQLAGAKATTILLAAMPLLGVALGGCLGADPMHHLLHTRPGAVCSLVALAMQCLGFVMASGLTRVCMREVC